MLDWLFNHGRDGYSRLYELEMQQGRPDLALAVAVKGRLGSETETRAAERWYDSLISSSDFLSAEAVASRFRLPDVYVKHAQTENLRLMASAMEDGSYTLLESAGELRRQAERIETEMMARAREGEKGGAQQRGGATQDIGASADEAQEAARIYSIGGRMVKEIGLLMYESELRLGNSTYAEMAASKYGISDEEKNRIVRQLGSENSLNNR